jgi:hypothetical protein
LEDRYDNQEFLDTLWKDRKLANIKSDSKQVAYKELFAMKEKY